MPASLITNTSFPRPVNVIGDEKRRGSHADAAQHVIAIAAIDEQRS